MVVFHVRIIAGLVITTDECPSPHITVVRLACVEGVTMKEQHISY